ncbi:hypothetical protein M1P56_35515 (plasmid) [Streptomyces sp. HU2014]|uniref:hypothetical protein n=1 Tax=Streptomyces sp. HU2014 TaxID=2939414 RepID=UPI00200D6A74|nr:hypothetical protein [Streptomyces sp. HU2014]UQI49698.1 hypothetical protein M1P56_35515 [Streptomyces sp. HU2014]
MRITIEGASAAFEEKLLSLLAEHRHELTVTQDTNWNPDRAELFLRGTTLTARTFVRMVVDGDGWADADALRTELGSLRGPTIALARALQRGVRQENWPASTPAPVTPVYDPDNPSWQRAIGYRMDSTVAPVFRAAFEKIDR